MNKVAKELLSIARAITAGYDSGMEDRCERQDALQEAQGEEEVRLEMLKELKKHDTKKWQYDKIDVCLTGRDADLELGQLGFSLDYVNDDEAGYTIYIGWTIPGDDVALADDDNGEEAVQRYIEQAEATLTAHDIPAEWDGDSWYAHWVIKGKSPVKFDNKKGFVTPVSAEQCIKNVWKTAKPVFDAISNCNKDLDKLAGY